MAVYRLGIHNKSDFIKFLKYFDYKIPFDDSTFKRHNRTGFCELNWVNSYGDTKTAFIYVLFGCVYLEYGRNIEEIQLSLLLSLGLVEEIKNIITA